MRQYLMVLWSGGGAVPPQVAVAKRLLRAGHEVSILAPRSLTETVRASGAVFEPYRHAPEHDAADPQLDLLRDWEAGGLGARARMRDNVVCGTAPAICDDILGLVEENRPDAIVTDYLLLGSYIAAERAGLPLAALMHSIFTLPRPGIPPFGPGWKVAHGRTGRLRDVALAKYQMRFVNARIDDLNALRHRHSLAPVRSVSELLMAADRVLILTSSAFDYPGPIPANARWAGAITDPDLPPLAPAGRTRQLQHNVSAPDLDRCPDRGSTRPAASGGRSDLRSGDQAESTAGSIERSDCRGCLPPRTAADHRSCHHSRRPRHRIGRVAARCAGALHTHGS
jgi:hypothetical protein